MLKYVVVFGRKLNVMPISFWMNGLVASTVLPHIQRLAESPRFGRIPLAWQVSAVETCFFIFRKMVNTMKALEEKIMKEGTVLPGNILKVGSFLNHQIDAPFMMEMGQEIARLFANDNVTRILTIETSGIPIAFAAAVAMNVPMVFAKKNRSSNLSGDICTAVVHSYTHNTDYTIVVEKQYIHPGDRVLIVDDFLANGKALEGLCKIVTSAGAEVAGATVAIEKGFQKGGDLLRSKGMHVESLAIIESMDDHSVTFRR